MRGFKKFLKMYMNKKGKEYVIKGDKSVWAIKYRNEKKTETEISSKYFNINDINLYQNIDDTYIFC